MFFISKYNNKSFALCFAMFFYTYVTFSQDLKFKHLNNEAGLSQVTVQTIFQDSQGFMWIGTQDGLNRYDGYHFKVFKNNPSNTKAISSNIINCIFEDSDGLIYCGTQSSGLAVYNKYTEIFTNYKPSLKNTSIPSPAVKSIISVNANELLIGTEQGLCVFNKNKQTFESIIPKDISGVFYVMKVFKTNENKFLVLAPRYGIYEYNPSNKTLTPFYIPKELKNENLDFLNYAFVTIDQKDKTLYCGAFHGGVHLIDVVSGTLKEVLNFQSQGSLLNEIKDIKQIPQSPNIAIATFGGLIIYNTAIKQSQIYTNDRSDNFSISSNNLLYILIDKTQNIWIGSEDNGLDINLKSSQTFVHLKNGKSKDANIINCFLETSSHQILVGTNNGIFLFNKRDNTFTNFAFVSESNPVTVQALYEDINGIIWIGTISKGLYTYNIQTKKMTSVLPKYFETAETYKIISDKNGTIWIGTYNSGLYAINPNTMEEKQYTTREGLSSNKILSLFYDADKNNIWLCTGDAGICILDFISNANKPFIMTLKHSDIKNSISSNVVNAIRKDKNGIYWIATTNGIDSYNATTKQFTHYTEMEGLANNYVYDIIPDKKGTWWIPTNNGLSNLNASNPVSFKNYTISDGLQNKEFNQGASLLCSDGFILVGGVNGFNYFNPSSITETKATFNSFIYAFTQKGKEVVMDSVILFKKHIELPYKENYFTLELIAPNYSSPEKTKFMYRLEGKDNDWSTPSSIRHISYDNLMGEYILKIKACNSNGIWNETPCQITINVNPPWYKTVWFYVIAGLLIITSIISFIRYRTNAVKKENKILENKVTERTKELAEKNKDITSSIQYAKRIQEAILPAQDLIYTTFRNSFILYKPKDIVSGDFYWFGEKNHLKIIAAVDCTGHGVPGAFMSMIGHNLLNQIVSEKGNTNPGIILQELHKGVQAALKQGQNQINTNDGMDVSIATINTQTKECLWAGAYRSLILINTNGELEKIEGNKYPIGGSQLDTERTFTTHSRYLNNDSIYLFSDGYADQFGGEKGKKFMVKKFHQNLLTIHHLSMPEQKQHLESQFNNWKGTYEQVDDVLIIGIKV